MQIKVFAHKHNMGNEGWGKGTTAAACESFVGKQTSYNARREL
jgi:hypothetical protein